MAGDSAADREKEGEKNKQLSTMAGGDREYIDFGGVTMTRQQVSEILTEYMKKPIALRKQGSSHYKCPYCKNIHKSEPRPYHTSVPCVDESRFNGIGIIVEDRFFLPGYGVTIIEYVEDGDVNKIIF